MNLLYLGCHIIYCPNSNTWRVSGRAIICILSQKAQSGLVRTNQDICPAVPSAHTWYTHTHTDEGLRRVCGSTLGEATSWALWAEVLSPAGQLTIPQHCAGLPCESWEESFLNQGLQNQPCPLPFLLFMEGFGRRVGLSCCHLVMPHASVIVLNLFPLAWEKN